MKKDRFPLIRFGIGLSAFVWLAAGLEVHGQAAPRIVVPRIVDPVVIDGRLDDPIWQKVAEVGPFRDNFTGEASGPATQAWMAYDREYLYFAFRCADENIWSTFTRRDAHLWTEEVVEVFLQPDPQHPNYIELEVNPLGAMLDIYLIDIRRPLRYESWNPYGIRWGVHVEGTVDGEPGDKWWTVEIAFPLADAVTASNRPPQPGDVWRMNLYRVEQKPERHGLAWSPTLKRDFHVPAAFGLIEFGK